MKPLASLVRIANLVAPIMVAYSTMPSVSLGAEIAFDLPSSIECRDVTTKEFAVAHFNLRMVEAKLRISARVIDGKPADIVEFLYFVKTDGSMRVQDYSPNTTLESAVAEDHIEITDATENSKATGLDAHVAYKPLLLGGSQNRNSKKSESSHYQQIAPKDTVLSGGTIDREHGVFFRIRPSRSASLEGGKEFTLVATVPRSWRGDLCTISCAARATKHSMMSTSVVPAGTSQVQVGMYLSGDAEAAALAENLRISQEAFAKLLAKHSKDNVFQTISTQTGNLLTGKTARQRRELEEAKKAVAETQARIEQLAK
jgi:hypothetical protein